METIRHRMNRTARWLARIFDVGLVVCFLGLPALYWFGMSGTIPRVLMIGGFLTAFGAFILLHAIGIRCPRCTNRLERYYRVTLFCFRGPESCPHCGLDLDRPAY